MKIETLQKKIADLQEKLKQAEAQQVKSRWLVTDNSLRKVELIKETKGYIFTADEKIKKDNNIFISHYDAKKQMIARLSEEISIEEEAVNQLKIALKRLNSIKSDEEFTLSM